MPPYMESKYTRRYRTVYDAVAGRLRMHTVAPGFTAIDEGLKTAASADDVMLDLEALKNPDVVVPVVDHPDLPDNDLLMAIHFYAAQYFGRYRPELIARLDEELLLAMGIMMEEEIKKMIGKNGHLVYATDKEKPES